MLDSVDFGHAQLTAHHHIHQETDLRGRQRHVSGMSRHGWFRRVTGDPRGVTGTPSVYGLP